MAGCLSIVPRHRRSIQMCNNPQFEAHEVGSLFHFLQIYFASCLKLAFGVWRIGLDDFPSLLSLYVSPPNRLARRTSSSVHAMAQWPKPLHFSIDSPPLFAPDLGRNAPSAVLPSVFVSCSTSGSLTVPPLGYPGSLAGRVDSQVSPSILEQRGYGLL